MAQSARRFCGRWVYSYLPTLPREAQSQTKYSQEHTGLPEALERKNKSNTKKKL
jgi:hypothetical protein